MSRHDWILLSAILLVALLGLVLQGTLGNAAPDQNLLLHLTAPVIAGSADSSDAGITNPPWNKGRGHDGSRAGGTTAGSA